MWKRAAFRYDERVPTMISLEERRYLYWLGQSAWTGQGNIVEIGPWLGGSTVCLASGMRASGHDPAAKLHVIDNFIWREFMASRAPLPIQPGDSFEPFFLDNLGGFEGIVRAHRLALPDESIDSDQEAIDKRFSEEERIPVLEELDEGPIEVLFIDGAKSCRGMRHLLKALNHCLIPGVSLLVCQDFKYWGCYWVPITMARLGEYLEPVHNVHDGTTLAFRLKTEIPDRVIAELEDHVRDMPAAETLAALDRASRLPADDGDTLGAANVRLAKVGFLSHLGDRGAAIEEFGRSEKSWPTLASSVQLERARSYLETR